MTPPSIGPYEVLRLLGEGGMGRVCLARDRTIGRLLALKMLRDGMDTPALRERFTREARAAGRLNHPNIVTIFHVDEDGGRPYIAMEYVEGLSLATVIGERIPLGLPRKLEILERVCDGLAAAHDAGFVHRDIKPGNIIVDTMWQPKILDFGLAVVPDASLALTLEHAVIGTLCYMSPEQLAGGDVDQRSDVFAVSVLAYELMSGERAFSGDTRQVIGQILSGRRSPSSPALDPALAAVIDKGMNADPGLRFQNAREMGHAFAAVRRQLPADTAVLDGHPAGAPAPDAALGRPVSAVVHSRANDRRERPARRMWAAIGSVSATGLAATALVLAWVQPQLRRDDGVAPEIGPSTATALTSPPSVVRESSQRVGRSATRLPPTSITQSAAPAEPVAAQVASPAAGPGAPATEEHSPEQRLDLHAQLLLPVGTPLSVRITSVLDSRRSGPGDAFAAVIEEPLVRGEREIAAPGAHVSGRVERGGLGGNGRPFLELSLTQLHLGPRIVPIRTGFYRAVAPAAEHGRGFTAIIIGGVMGAAVGGVAAGGKGAVAGGAIGSTVAAMGGEDTATEYHFGVRVPFRLAEAVYEGDR